MYNTNIANAQDNLYSLVNMAIEDNEVININTTIGNALIINSDDYSSLIETLYLSSDTEYKKELIEAHNAPEEDFITEYEFWNI